MSFLKLILSFLVKIWSAFKLLGAFVKKLFVAPPSINIEKAGNVVIFSPVIIGHYVRDVTMKIDSHEWPKRLESAKSVAPSVIEIPKTPSLDRQAVLVYKDIMRGLQEATRVLNPILSQALRLCCTRKAAHLAGNSELAEFIQTKLDQIASLPSHKGYTPPDIKKWYERFCELDDAGDLKGVVIPCLERASQKLVSQLGIVEEAQEECARFISWLHTRLIGTVARPFFRGRYLNVGVVYVGELPPAAYVEVSIRLLKEEKTDMIILGAYGAGYSATSAQAAAIVNKFKIRDAHLAQIILAPQFKFEEPGEVPPFLSSYFFINADFAQPAKEIDDRYASLAQRLSKNTVMVEDEKISLAKVSHRIAAGKMVLVKHNWQTMKEFFRVCFHAIINYKTKIVCHKIEIRPDGGATGDKPCAYVSLVLGPHIK